MTTKTGGVDGKVAARSAAARRLREAHPEEYRNLMVEEHEARGVKYTPRLTAEERASVEVQRLLREFPDLRVNLK